MTTVGGEKVRAFVPPPLPSNPPLRLGLLQVRLDFIYRLFVYDGYLTILNGEM